MERSILNSTRIDNTNILPLRWLANLAGNISSAAMMRIAWAEEDNKAHGLMYKINGFLYDYLFPFYYKYGTFYELEIDMTGLDWNDRDSEGRPYWHFLWNEDPETGDAWRLIKK
jgi:hypothetical protein